jgi:hypothetical protein
LGLAPGGRIPPPSPQGENPEGKAAVYVVKADEPVRAGPHGATAACEGDNCVVKAAFGTNRKHGGTNRKQGGTNRKHGGTNRKHSGMKEERGRTIGKRATGPGSEGDGTHGPAAIDWIAPESGRFRVRSVRRNEGWAMNAGTARARSARLRSTRAASPRPGPYGEANSMAGRTAPEGAGCGQSNSLVRRLTTLVRCSPTPLTETLPTETLPIETLPIETDDPNHPARRRQKTSPASRCGNGGLFDRRTLSTVDPP